MALDVPICVERHAVFSQQGDEIFFTPTAKQVVLSLIDGRSNITFLIADTHPFLDLFDGVVRQTQLGLTVNTRNCRMKINAPS